MRPFSPGFDAVFRQGMPFNFPNMHIYSKNMYPNSYKWCKLWDALHTVRMG